MDVVHLWRSMCRLYCSAEIEACPTIVDLSGNYSYSGFMHTYCVT